MSDFTLGNLYDLMYKAILKESKEKNSNSMRSDIFSKVRHIEIISTQESTDEAIK